MKKSLLIECRRAESGEHLCYVGFKFNHTISDNSCYGRIETEILFKESWSGQNKQVRHHNANTYYRDHSGTLCMPISRFSLPVPLQGSGIGPVIWSMIYKGLPEKINSGILLFGSLTSTDAFTRLIDKGGKPVYEIIKGMKKPVMLNQITRRNRFWESMLLPLDKTGPVIKCDEKGNGAFKGIFKDPLSPAGSSKITAIVISEAIKLSA